MTPSPRTLGPTDPRVTLGVVPPNRWSGERACLVGPFRAKDTADTFASYSVEFGHYETFSKCVRIVADAWYVEIRPALTEAASEPTP